MSHLSHLTRSLPALSLLATACLGSCSISMTDRASRQGDLVESADKVHATAQEASKKAHTALDLLTKLTTSKFDGGAVKAFSSFEAALRASQAETAVFKGAVESTANLASTAFTQWKSDLELYSSPSLRLRSRERLEAAKKGYDDIISAGQPAARGLEDLHRTMRDHALFLGHDLTAASVRSIQGDVEKLARDLETIEDQIFRCRSAAASYVQSHSQPERMDAATEENR